VLVPARLLRSNFVRVALVAAVLLLATLAFRTGVSQSPVLSATDRVGPETLGASVQVEVSLTSHRPFPVPVSVSLLPVAFHSQAAEVYVFEDSSYPPLFGTTPEVAALAAQIGLEFQLLGAATTVSTIDAAQLPSFLEANTSATLVVANYGGVPTTVFSNSSDELGTWIRAGGSLVWAGDPLAYYSEPPNVSPSGVWPGGLGWQAQVKLLGFPLTDSVPSPDSSPLSPGSGPIYGVNAAPLAGALGLVYNGTLFGANTTELAAHGGLSLGFSSVAIPGGPAPRTSLAYIPVGNGSVYYFGGAVNVPSGPYVPEGGVRLADDIAQLLAFPFTPSPGPVVVQSLSLGFYAQTQVTLSGSFASSEVGLLVRSNLAGSVLYEWATPVRGAPLR
jgi:hypothetical protein